MGYYTSFHGKLEFTRALTPEEITVLEKIIDDLRTPWEMATNAIAARISTLEARAIRRERSFQKLLSIATLLLVGLAGFSYSQSRKAEHLAAEVVNSDALISPNGDDWYEVSQYKRTNGCQFEVSKLGTPPADKPNRPSATFTLPKAVCGPR